MNEEQLLDLKIEKLEELLKLDDLLIEAMENDDIDSMVSFMEKKFIIINEVKAIDRKLKKRTSFEQREQKFRDIKQALKRLKNKEEKLLYMAYEKRESIEKELKKIEGILRIKRKYKKMRDRKNVFERIG